MDFPDPAYSVALYEPFILGTIITPGKYINYLMLLNSCRIVINLTICTIDEYLGSVLSLCMAKRGVQKSSTNIDNSRILLQCFLPLNEIVIDFHDTLKSITSGFGSFSYEDHGYEISNLVKV